ncbi:hypothetical protein [Actinomycetospora termitidis]|uniref:Uncharacterized protein n=1 Tax=Actinomycetospora termitidis TaxID=3053470 RepID=A0ABT7M506_9PSEU|nr:hypothetical protein [Actinomycetospora sp. Odt1-22]MDL5155746.1 hypothetical protein [Actinomycetospora sp. Odt1-22]
MSTTTDRRPGPRGGLLFTPETAPWRRRPERREVPDVGWVQVGPAGRRVREIEAWFDRLFHEAPWPARVWQLLARADEQGVDLVSRDAIVALPAGVYRRPEEVAAALSALPPVFAHRSSGR